MGIVVKSSLKVAIFSYFGILIGAFNTLWLFPKILAPEQIGTITLLVSIASAGAIFVQFGLANITDKFFPYYRDHESKHNGFFMFMLVYPLVPIFVLLLVFPFVSPLVLEKLSGKSAYASIVVSLIVPLVVFITYINVLEAYLRAHFQLQLSSIVKEVFLRIGILLLVLVCAAGLISFEQVVYGNVCSYGLACLIFLVFIWRKGWLYRSVFLKKEEIGRVKEMITYALFIILGSGGAILLTYIDSVMLGFMSGVKDAGIYTIAFYIGTTIEIPRRIIAQSITPLITSAWKENNVDQIKNIYKRAAINQFIIGAILFLLVSFNLDYLFEMIPNGSVYKAGKWVVIFIALTRLIDLSTSVNGEILLYSKYYKANLLFTLIIGLINITLNYLLILKYGLVGAALAILISLTLHNLIKMVFIYYRMNMHPFSSEFIRILCLFLLTLTIHFGMQIFAQRCAMGGIYLLSANGLVILFCFLIPILVFKLSSELNAIWDSFIAIFCNPT